jgi:hypothetical protein
MAMAAVAVAALLPAGAGAAQGAESGEGNTATATTASAAPAATAAPAGGAAATADGAGSGAAQRSALRDSAGIAERMYYCGELFVFSESMLKTNYEMAAIAAKAKSHAQGTAAGGSAGALPLGEIKDAYNAAGESYNSWVDVSGVLEGYVGIVADSAAYTQPNLQSAFRYTLATVSAARELLDEAEAYLAEPSPTAQQKRALIASADSVARKSAKAASTIETYSKRALAAYRKLFDQFARSAGVDKVELPAGQAEPAEPAA